ncbi:hypothetical protein H2198_009155 [Neophaeococcomyces mojaviensis]|uniref:Uncharacterized protein n=1 Tax=Neophaeococcomyces mojaviensis TaxID=3383035 RepID=A0ACC2ZVA2_9EURO|nr:hypothetical protein H2198_009155 [Knufia sp. JES_112]
MRRATATPCPVSAHQLKNINETYTEDSTANIEYTTAFDASFRNVKPRRAQGTHRGPTVFAIHEDVAEIAGQLPSTLSQPAKRVLPRSKPLNDSMTNNDPAPGRKPFTQVHNAKRTGPLLAPRRVPAGIPPVLEPTPKEENGLMEHSKEAGRRPARRKTLYIPSDDTTQPTMWMGIFSPVKNEVLESCNQGETPGIELTGIAAQMAEKRRRRTSSIQPRAKRVPLRLSVTAQAAAITPTDRAGEPTGKENVPPGHQQGRITKTTKHLPVYADSTPMANDRDVQRKKFLTQARLEKSAKPRERVNQSPVGVSTMYEVGKNKLGIDQSKNKRLAWNAGPRGVVAEDRHYRKESEVKTNIIRGSSPELPPRPHIPSRFVQPVLKDIPQMPPHIPLLEHIENPEMYEDDWLYHQEIVITQLLNSLFDKANSRSGNETDCSTLRGQLIGKYNSPEVSLVYSRVQAAALYGSLSLSHEAMFNIQNLAKDVGRKKAFLNFWLDNYDNEMLQAALETISGKQVRVQGQRRSSSSSSPRSTNRRSIAQFVEEYMLRHEDARFKPAGTGNISDLGSKTIVKSLMLIKALDLLKDGPGPIVGKCLFRRTAALKSSSTAVQHMIKMLNPAVGDAVRALRQLGYEVFYEQDPLHEICFKVENLAVDLRDGVNLTRLVEILLYRSEEHAESRAHIHDTKTICMSEGETIIIDSGESRPLTRHLKLPSISRATKLWNVQLGLGALLNVKHIEALIGDVHAHDIVDGYREKTVKLLWVIIGRLGLTGIIDRSDIKQEIRRLDPAAAYSTDMSDDESDGETVEERCETLLKCWTKAVAASKGLVVRNFTTSFSDGQVFRAIVDEYEPYLIEERTTERQPLQQRLCRLGCSKQFSDLFCSSSGQIHIFGKDFVLAALAFLCSRVVGPSRLCRNAIKIQRCWRKHWQVVLRERQVIKKQIAEACAATICSKEGAINHKPAPAYSDPTVREDEKTEIGSDIWLSL